MMQKNDLEKLQQTMNTPGWRDIIFPQVEFQFEEGLKNLLAGNIEKAEGVTKLQAITAFAELIGTKIDVGTKAKNYLNKKLGKE